MRCKRCHAVIAEGRKSCPNCGTLIRKKRGNITLSSQSGVQINRFADGVSDGIYNLKMAIKRDSRILILLVAVPLVLIGSILLVSCGASSCACSCSCGGNEKTALFEEKYNSYKPSYQFAVGDTLYYISDGSIMSRTSDESYKHIYDSVSAADLQADEKYIYFRENNTVKRIEPGRKAVSGTDIAEMVLDYSSDKNYSLRYFIAEGEIYYTLTESGSDLTTLYSDNTLLCGKYADIGYMKGRIYYTVSDSDTTRTLYSIKTDGTDERTVASGISDYQLGGGYVYTVSDSTEGKTLSRIDKDGMIVMEWDIAALTGGELSSVAANDMWLCFVNTSEEGSVVYRIEHDSVDVSSVFAYSDKIELTGVSGDWYAFESIKYTDGKESGRTYSVRNSRNGKSAV